MPRPTARPRSCTARWRWSGPAFPVLALAARDASEPSVAEAAGRACRARARRSSSTSRLDRAGAAAAARRDRPSADRPAAADRVLLCLRRGLRPPSRPRSRPAAKSAQGDGNRYDATASLWPAARIFDGEAWHDDAALLVRDGERRGDRAARQAFRPGVDGRRNRRRHARAGLRRPAGQWRRRRHAQRPSGCREHRDDLPRRTRRSARPRCCRR